MLELDFDDELAEDDEIAFCQLEREFRQEREKTTEETDNGNTYRYAQIRYMNRVLAAAQALGLNEFEGWEIPLEGAGQYEYFDKFDQAVEHFFIRVRITRARKKSRDSVYLSASEKSKIRHYIGRIKAHIEESNLDIDKKERLFDILATLENEIDRDRTRLNALASAAMKVAYTLRDFEEEGVRPYYKYIMAILGIAGEAQSDQQRKLPAPKEKKRLAPPKPSIKNTYELDDDIPF